jgi:hypothetical protein
MASYDEASNICQALAGGGGSGGKGSSGSGSGGDGVGSGSGSGGGSGGGGPSSGASVSGPRAAAAEKPTLVRCRNAALVAVRKELEGVWTDG